MGKTFSIHLCELSEKYFKDVLFSGSKNLGRNPKTERKDLQNLVIHTHKINCERKLLEVLSLDEVLKLIKQQHLWNLRLSPHHCLPIFRVTIKNNEIVSEKPRRPTAGEIGLLDEINSLFSNSCLDEFWMYAPTSKTCLSLTVWHTKSSTCAFVQYEQRNIHHWVPETLILGISEKTTKIRKEKVSKKTWQVELS